jgi:dimethylglycine catabolism A
VAGMEAAWVAAARGHEVTVFCSSPDTGGKTRLLAALPGGESLSSIYDYQRLAAKRAGVRLELAWRAAASDVLGLAPDAVVIASGASMSWPRRFPQQWQQDGILLDLRSCMAALASVTHPQGGTAVLYDMDATEGTYSAAERLRALYDRVVIMTPRDRIADDVPLVTRLGVLRRFAHLGIEVLPLVEPDAASQWEEAALCYRNVYTGKLGRIDDVALFTYATPRIADTELADELQSRVPVLHVIGDAYAPRTTLAATAQGHDVGHLL